MATTVTKLKNSWSLEVQSGVDKDGNPKWSKKALPGYIHPTANMDKVSEVSDAIAEILEVNTRNTYLTEVEHYN